MVHAYGSKMRGERQAIRPGSDDGNVDVRRRTDHVGPPTSVRSACGAGKLAYSSDPDAKAKRARMSYTSAHHRHNRTRHVPPIASHFDTTTPALVLKMGYLPLHHGGLGAIRSLGRVGVPVYGVHEDRFTPAAMSKYLQGRFLWVPEGTDAEELLDGMSTI